MPRYITVYSHPNVRFPIEDHETILEAAQRHGIDIPSSCESGICSTCKGKIYQGNISYRGKAIHGIDPDNNDHEALLCMAHAETDVTLDHPDIPPPHRAKQYSYQVAHCETLANHLVRLQLKPTEAKMPFLAGQYVELLDQDKRHPLSIASMPGEDHIELHVQINASHEAAQRIVELCDLQKIVTLLGPKGKAFWHPTDLPVILIAGGSGFAPIQSILKHLLHIGFKHPIHLYWGVRDSQFLYADAQIKASAKQHPNLTYIPVVSENTQHWHGRTGLVHEAVLADFPELSKYAIYLAGPFVMSYAARDAFEQKGALLSQMYSDAFAFQKK